MLLSSGRLGARSLGSAHQLGTGPCPKPAVARDGSITSARCFADAHVLLSLCNISARRPPGLATYYMQPLERGSLAAARPLGSLHIAAAHAITSHFSMPVAAARWRVHSRRQQQRQMPRGGRPGNQSVDDDNDEEGDAGVTQELGAYEVERIRQMGRHLDLMWNVGQKSKPEPCACCLGSGARHCEYCHSTGAMMVGHERFCSLELGCKPCPICNGTGEVRCAHCQGTGFRAGWLEPGCPID